MTREKAKELLPIIQAWTEGKEIQFKSRSGRWTDLEENEGLSFVYSSSDYRIKSEPKYRTFKNQEECWNEMMKHQPFGWIRSINNQCLRNIGSINYTTRGIGINNSVMYFNTAFNEYKFIDGTSFGIKEE